MNQETIVLVHGLWMNGLEMTLLRHRLTQDGYHVERFKYNSMLVNPIDNAARLNQFVSELNAKIIHFIGYSLGGIVIRHLFYRYPDQKPGRVVTMSTPHKPSYSAYALAKFPPGKLILGQSIINGLLGNAPPWSKTHDLGSIAGTLRLGLGMFISGLARPNDGAVAVDETRIDGMKDHVEIRASHFGLLLSEKAAKQILYFLKNGMFH